MTKDNKNNKIKILIVIIILLLAILTIILISVFSCKPKSKNTKQLEIVGKTTLEGENSIAGQSETYVAKYKGETINDCTWSLDTSNNHEISFNFSINCIQWTDNILSGTYPLVLTVEKDGYDFNTLDINLIINLPKLYIVGEDKLEGSYTYASNSNAYTAIDFFDNDIDNCLWNLSPTISGISFDATTYTILWNNNIPVNVYSLVLTAEKNGYTAAIFNIELDIYDNFIEWIDTGISKKTNINMEIQSDRFYRQRDVGVNYHQFEYYEENNGSINLTSFNASTIKTIHFKFPEVLTNDQFFSTDPVSDRAGFMMYFCYSMSNLIDCSIIMPKIVPDNIGGYFMASAFENCTSLTKLNDDFVLPTNYSKINNYFLYRIFYNCTNLEKLPDGFIFPDIVNVDQYMDPSLDWYVGASGYMYQSFYKCENLLTLNSSFSFSIINLCIDRDIQINDFAAQMFYECKKLNFLDNSINQFNAQFIYPENVNLIAGTDFYTQMFYNCTQLTKLPNNFNLSQNHFFSIDSRFCQGMFSGCVNLKTLPEDFSLPSVEPQNIEDSFCEKMFYNCNSLQTAPNGKNFNIPNETNSASNFCYLMFDGCPNFTNNVSPSPNDQILIARNT